MIAYFEEEAVKSYTIFRLVETECRKCNCIQLAIKYYKMKKSVKHILIKK